MHDIFSLITHPGFYDQYGIGQIFISMWKKGII